MTNFDPLGDYLRGTGFNRGYGRPLSPIQPFTDPAEEDANISGITDKLIGGVSWLGSLVDKYTGGRAVRGLLGGNPRELASILPFSDQFGITDPRQETSGRQLLENVGALSPYDTGWGSTVAGVLADMALSPATYLGGVGTAASATKAGRLAKYIGEYPKTAARRVSSTLADVLPASKIAAAERAASIAAGQGDVAIQGVRPFGYHKLGPLRDVLQEAEPLAKLIKLKIPFFPGELGIGGPGTLDALSAAKDVALRGKYSPLSPFASAYDKYVEPLIVDPIARRLGAMFRYANQGNVSAAGQAGAQALDSLREAEQIAGKEFTMGTRLAMRKAGVDPLDVAALMEGRASTINPTTGRAISPLAGKVNQFAQDIYGVTTPLAQDIERLGGDIQPLQGWFPRQQLFNDKPGMFKPREDIFRHVQGGRMGINDLSLRSDLAGPERTVNQYAKPDLAATQIILHGARGAPPVLQISTGDIRALKQYRKAAGPGSASDIKDQLVLAVENSDHATFDRLTKFQGHMQATAEKLADAPELARWAATNTNPDLINRGIPLFPNDPMADLASYLHGGINKKYRMMGEQNLLASQSQPYQQLAAGTRLDQIIKGMPGFEGSKYLKEALAAQHGIPPAAVRYADFAALPEIATDVIKHGDRFSFPQSVNDMLGWFDKATNLTKASQTSPWPAFLIRNLGAGQLHNLGEGATGNYGTGAALARGETPVGLARRLPQLGTTDQEVAEALRVKSWARGTAGSRATSTEDIYSGAIDPSNNLLSQLTGASGDTVLDIMKQWLPNSMGNWSPIKLGKDWGLNPEFGPFQGGRAMTQRIEDVNRLNPWISGMEQGMTPNVAAQLVDKIHYVYGNYSPFERDVMRRVIPYYGWLRGNLPYVTEQAVTRPGGLTGTGVRGSLYAQEELPQPGFVPPYMAGGMALPIGAEQNGTQRFLSSIGLPFEDLNVVKGGPRWLENTLMGLAGQTNPLLKAIPEFMTGKQFYSQRDLADLYAPTGSTLAEQVLMNSPASRAYTTSRQLLDPRKWENPLALPFNLLTGGKLTDVDMAKMRDIAIRQAANQMLQGQQGIGKIETLYLKPEVDPATLPPEEVALLRLVKTVEKRAKEQAKAQKAEGK